MIIYNVYGLWCALRFSDSKLNLFVTLRTTGVIHMEQDLLIDGNILFSSHELLITTNGTSTFVLFASSLSGDHNITVDGFVQTSKSQIVFVDRTNHCLRLLDRLTSTFFKLVGDCKRSGFRDGTDPIFSHPLSVIQDNRTPCLLYVTDQHNGAVRMITTSLLPRVTTLLTGKIYYGITQDPTGVYLYITYHRGVERYNLLTNTSVGIFSSGKEFGASLMYDSNFRGAFSIVLLNDLIILSPYVENRLGVIDTQSGTITLICSGVAGHKAGNLSACELDLPLALLEVDGGIYVGDRKGISVIKGL